MEDKKEIQEITRRLSNLETHVINLIIPIQNIAQCLKSTTDIQHLIEALKVPISINDSKLKIILDNFEREMRKFERNIQEIKQDTKIEEIKYIGKRLNEIEILLKKMQEKGVTKNIQLDFTCDGYQLVKKPIGYDPEDPIEKPDENLHKLLNSLLAREAKAIIHRFGLLGEKAKTYQKVGEELGISSERARAICAMALRKCRHPSRKELVRKISHKEFKKEITSKK